MRGAHISNNLTPTAGLAPDLCGSPWYFPWNLGLGWGLWLYQSYVQAEVVLRKADEWNMGEDQYKQPGYPQRWK